MALRTKTIEYFWPTRTASATNNTLTTLDQITIFIPEAAATGANILFRSVVVDIVAMDMRTGSGNTTTRNINFRVGAAAYSSYNLTSTYSNSGENMTFTFNADVTDHMNTNWSGASMTADCQFQINNAGSTTTSNNVNARITITYEFDDTNTQNGNTKEVKTVFLPLNAPTGSLATSKPGTAIATIPALDTWLPEASKTIRQTTIVIQGNDYNSLNTTDLTISVAIDNATAITSGILEAALLSDRWFRYAVQPSFTTNDPHDFFIWGNVAKAPHLQVYMVITYEYDPDATTTVLNSLLLPMEFDSPMGSSDTEYLRASRELFIQEPATITTQESALFLFYHKAAVLTTVGVRVNEREGATSFTLYPDLANVMCGSDSLMFRCENDLSLTRGRNKLEADIYRTSTTNLGFNVSAFWIVNYTSGKASQGTNAHNHTTRWIKKTTQGTSADVFTVIAASDIDIPEDNFYIVSSGLHYLFMTNSTGVPSGVTIQIERKSDEGGLAWESAYIDISHDDPETGIRHCFATTRTVFNRWKGDPDPSRLDILSSRRIRISLAQNTASYDILDAWVTYHSITHEVSGEITGASGNTVNIALHRALTGEKVLETSRVGNGSYSFDWYDNTEPLYVEAYEEDTINSGRSSNNVIT
jgi:hypothetical protein